MKAIHEKDKRICRTIFFEAASICEYSTGGDLLHYGKSAKTRKKHFRAVKYKALKPEFIHSNN